MFCDRCKDQTHALEKCNYCSRSICRNCEKSSKRVGKVKRFVICKDCWGNLKKRKTFKST